MKKSNVLLGRPPIDIVPYTGKQWLSDGEVPPRHSREPVKIVGDLWIGPLDELRLDIARAIDSPGENHRVPRPPTMRFAIYRQRAPKEPIKGMLWDADRAIAKCIQISRLIRPSSLAYRYACRIDLANGLRTIIPAGVIGHQALAWCVDESSDAIKDSDIALLRPLLAAYERAPLTNRVRNAIWMHEHLAWTRLMNIRWPLLVTALEALIHTDDRALKRGRLGATDQFTRRLSKLQALLRLTLWTDDDLLGIYEHRSAFAHGRGGTIDALRGDALRLYKLAEDGLRAVLRRAIEHEPTADIFSSDRTIRTSLAF